MSNLTEEQRKELNELTWKHVYTPFSTLKKLIKKWKKQEEAKDGFFRRGGNNKA